MADLGRLERHFGREQVQLERMKELSKERNGLYEKQNDLKGQKQQIERAWER